MNRKYFRLTLPFPPTVNDYLHYRVMYKGKRPIVTSYKTKESKEFEIEASNIIKREMKRQGWETPDSNTWVRVESIWFTPRTSIDSNNLYKLPIDALQDNMVVLNDNKVLEGAVNYFVDSKNPRIELNIYTLQKKGIFMSEEHLEEFKKYNCYLCNKDYITCRVLKEALDNKITENISLGDCICFKKKAKKN